MNQNLIDDLCSDLRPMKRLRPPGIRWLYTVMAIFGLGCLALIKWHEQFQFEGILAFFFGSFLVLSFFAFQTSVPGYRKHRTIQLTCAIAAALGLWSTFTMLHSRDMTAVSLGGFQCMAVITFLGSLITGFFGHQLSASFLVRPFETACLMSFGSMSLVGGIMHVACPHSGALHHLYWHLLPLILLSGLGGFLSGSLFKKLQRRNLAPPGNGL